MDCHLSPVKPTTRSQPVGTPAPTLGSTLAVVITKLLSSVRLPGPVTPAGGLYLLREDLRRLPPLRGNRLHYRSGVWQQTSLLMITRKNLSSRTVRNPHWAPALMERGTESQQIRASRARPSPPRRARRPSARGAASRYVNISLFALLVSLRTLLARLAARGPTERAKYGAG